MAAEIDFCRGWDPRQSASVNHRQTGRGPYQRGWSDDACATLQRRLRHELAWIWSDFLSEHVWLQASRRAAGSTKGQEGGQKRQPARCSRKTQDKFAVASMARKLLHRCTGACTSCGDIYIHVCICIYIYIYVYVHIFAYVYMYIFMHICMCMCMYVYIYLCTHVCMYICTCVYVYIYVYIRVHTHFCREYACIHRCRWAPCMCRCVR